MSAKAGDLLNIMDLRLRIQQDRDTNPAEAIKVATKLLVEKLSKIDPNEDIVINAVNSNGVFAQYIRKKTGVVLAELRDDSIT